MGSVSRRAYQPLFSSRAPSPHSPRRGMQKPPTPSSGCRRLACAGACSLLVAGPPPVSCLFLTAGPVPDVPYSSSAALLPAT